MSAPSSISSSEQVSPRYPLALLAAVVLAFALFFAVTLTVDPYGISPVKLSIPGINVYKPKRLDIDRLIKPIEVWQKQPKTVFLGTSRIHQSIDPALFDGTDFAPAYNASVPAVSLGMNISYLELYSTLDPKLETVFVELFMYNFLGQEQSHTHLAVNDVLANGRVLGFSADALWASAVTVFHNLIRGTQPAEIAPGGYFQYPPGHNPEGPFAGFAAGIWPIHANATAATGSLVLSEEAIGAAQEIADTAHALGKTIYFVATPNHAYSDYYFDQADAWPLIEQWLTRLSAIAPVFSFSQPNDWVYEPVGPAMHYWNDPFHFSLAMGAGMEKAILGQPDPSAPANFMVQVTPANAAAVVAERRDGIRAWAAANPEYVAAFAAERAKAGF